MNQKGFSYVVLIIIKNNKKKTKSREMTGNKYTGSFHFHDNFIVYHYYLFQLYKAKFQALI